VHSCIALRVANSGSYFATSNVKTKYFFSSMVWTFDIILDNGSHQTAMHTVLNELSSQHGLRIKTLQQNHSQIPSTCPHCSVEL
jgi:Nucleotide-diphospho-sugar transferase